MPAALREGIYEHLLTKLLDGGVEAAKPARAEMEAVDDVDLPRYLARYFARELETVLRSAMPAAEQVALMHALLDRVAELAPKVASDDRVAEPARVLRSIYRTAPPLRPSSPLSTSTLLTRAPKDPALGHELAREIESADGVEILAAFVTVSGVRVVREALDRAARRGARIRLLTTVFTGTTEVDAVETIAGLPGAQVRVSYDTRRTRLHAKAWLFERASGLHTAYVGSANLTATALGTGLEWMVKVCAADLASVIDKFRGTFDGLWNDAEFVLYDGSDEGRDRLRSALRGEREPTSFAAVPHFTFQPFAYQSEILDRLEAERTVHNRRRNLVVAATGTGKTMIAAFDYLRACDRAGTRPRLLFLAHRRELLDQARSTFRHVLRDHAFGELWVDGIVPVQWEYVFATVQSAAHMLGERITPEHFAFVVVDECHHAPAKSYQEVLRSIAPDILLGLTATPERSDGKSLLPDFCGRIAAELRLWHALERQLLVPFEYYGISDGTQLKSLAWSRRGYSIDALSNLYTGNEARVDLIVAELRRKVVNPRNVRALAFCVSVDHARFMAKALTERGIPADAVSGESSREQRESAPSRLESRALNVICTADLYNEGVDLPFVDTLLLLRPTTSATLFMQQIGRGLRLARQKSSCLILDFIGQHHSEFRFDEIYAALTGVPRARLERDVREGFPFLPSGSVFQLDAVAKERVLASLKNAVAGAVVLTKELREVAGRGGGDVTLGAFLAETGREVEDVYRAGGWTALRSKAGVIPEVDSNVIDLTSRFDKLLHTDDVTRLATWKGAVAVDVATYQRRMTMLEFQMNRFGVLREPVEVARSLFGPKVVREELAQLADVLTDRVGLADETYPVPAWPLALHRHYERREIVAAVGAAQPGKKGNSPQAGIMMLKEEQRELLFVTLDKTSASFSPTTRYRDYAISPTLFHWETQAIASRDRPTGRRYLDSAINKWTFWLFVRTDKEAPFAFLGEAKLESATGDRPIAITWRLENAIPGGLFGEFSTLAQG